ncbi:MAG: type 4a pilus biogenesis protein PilO [Armatimonadetes bacterium]|nr:type 4a pilus biogenesis protein PilO [Armatimonadota bacterium]
MKNPKSVESMFKVLGGLILVTLLASAGVSYLAYDQIKIAQEEHKKRSEEVVAAKASPERLKVLNATINGLYDHIAYLEQGVTPREYVPTLLKQMEAMATSVGLRIAAVRPVSQAATAKPPQGDAQTETAPKVRKPYDEQTISVAVKGDFWATMRFLKALNQFPKILAVQRVTVQTKADADSDGNPQLEVTTEVKAIIFKQAANDNASGQGG